MPDKNEILNLSELVVHFKRNIEIEERIPEFNEALTNHFDPIFNTKVAKEANPEILRFVANSKNGHSNIKVTQNKLIFSTIYNYNDKFQYDFDTIKKYLEERYNVIINLLEKEKVENFGIIFHFFTELEESSILSYIKKQSNINLVNENTKDLIIHYSQKYKNNYFVNVTYSKTAQVVERGKINVMNDEFIPDPQSRQKRTGISYKIDFNNKPAKTPNDFNSFFGTFFQLITKNKLNDFLTANIN